MHTGAAFGEEASAVYLLEVVFPLVDLNLKFESEATHA